MKTEVKPELVISEEPANKKKRKKKEENAGLTIPAPKSTAAIHALKLQNKEKLKLLIRASKPDVGDSKLHGFLKLL